jgi:hypothetical protein
MQRHDIERLVQRWTREAIAEGRLDVFDELLGKDVYDRSGPAPSKGVEPFKARAAAVRAAFVGIDIRAEDLLVEGDAIAWRWALTGTRTRRRPVAQAPKRQVVLTLRPRRRADLDACGRVILRSSRPFSVTTRSAWQPRSPHSSRPGSRGS